MRESLKQLKKKVVETVSGTELGTIKDVVIDIDTHGIVQYDVSSRFGRHEYTVHRNQIVRIEEEKIVVYDTVMPLTDEQETPPIPSAPEPVAMREE